MACEVDVAFIQPKEHRPKLSISEAGRIPLIDLSALNHPELVDQVGSACRQWGFFQVINHGVPLELRQRIETAAKKFFALPMEEKLKVRRDAENPMGYFENEHTKNVRDWKEVFDFTVDEPMVILTSHGSGSTQLQVPINQWPKNPPDFRDACKEYANGVEKLAYKLVELISLSLNLPAKRLNGFFKDQSSRVRLNHYPPCPSPELTLGLGRHKDTGGLTILAQDDVGGLDVKRKVDGEWVRVKPIPNSFIINVGDIIQVWSNDEYESVEHRVMVNSKRERFSIPFFFNPAHYVMVKPLEDLVNDQNPPKYKEYNWWEFRMARMNSNFKKMDVENLQISHFKIA